MGHDVIKCGNCGSDIMEGHGDWLCDECGWYYNAVTGKTTGGKKIPSHNSAMDAICDKCDSMGNHGCIRCIHSKDLRIEMFKLRKQHQ